MLGVLTLVHLMRLPAYDTPLKTQADHLNVPYWMLDSPCPWFVMSFVKPDPDTMYHESTASTI